MQKIEYIDIATLKSHPENPRRIQDEAFKVLCKSIKDNPDYFDTRPILCNKDFVIFAGNMRYKAAIEIGLEKVPVAVMDISPQKEKELMIRDNVQNGEWNWEILTSAFDVEELKGWGLDSITFHEINDKDPEEFQGFNDIVKEDSFHHLNIAFDTPEEMQVFLEANNIKLDNNYKRVGKVISIHWPIEQRQDIKSVVFE